MIDLNGYVITLN